MAVFIELVTEPFQQVFSDQLAEGRARGRAGLNSVRRPLRGLEVKDDTYAIFRVIQSDGTEIPLIDSGDQSGKNFNYSNFILQSVHEARMEKQQIIETFGETFIFFFGEQPRFLDCSAVLVNSNDFNWKAEFLANYDQYLRGTRLTELGACAYLFYDDNIVSGYLLQCDVVDNANNPMEVQMQFRMILVNYNNVSFVGDPNFPIRASVSLIDLDSNSSFNVGDLTSVTSGELLDQIVSAGTGISGQVINGQFVPSGAIQRDVPLRGLIAANKDEWTGAPAPSRNDYTDDPFFSTVDEVRNINLALSQLLLPIGVDSDYATGPDFMSDSGFGPSFSDDGIGIGFGASGAAGATFGASFGYSSSYSTGVSATAGASANLNAGVGSTAFAGSSPVVAPPPPGLVTGQGTGGIGAGGGYSPGVGLGIGASAGIGMGASYAGSSGAGAGVSVGGQTTSFAFISAPGDIDDSPGAYAQLSVLANAGF